MIADLEARANALARQSEEVQRQIQQTSATLRSPDGAVTVTVAPNGALRHVEFSPRVGDFSHVQLGQVVMTTVRRAQAQAADQVAARLGEGDVAEFGMNLGALALDGLSAMIDPLGTLATAGIGWLIEHISFLREPLDRLAGNSDNIKTAVSTWNQAALALDTIAQDQQKAVASQVSGWEQGAADRFRASQGRLAAETKAMSATCISVAKEVTTAGTITAAVRGMIRDLIAMFIWEVIRNAVIAPASSWVSFGSSPAAFAAWTVGRAAVLLGKITKQLAKLMRLVMRIAGRLKGLFAKVGDVLKGLARFGKGGRGAGGAGGVARAADAPAAPGSRAWTTRRSGWRTGATPGRRSRMRAPRPRRGSSSSAPATATPATRGRRSPTRRVPVRLHVAGLAADHPVPDRVLIRCPPAAAWVSPGWC